jgi:hypothetical protein
MDSFKNKTPARGRGNERVANATEPDVVVPVIVVPVDVDLALVVPAVERGVVV